MTARKPIQIDAALHRRLLIAAAKAGVRVKVLAERAIDTFLKKGKP